MPEARLAILGQILGPHEGYWSVDCIQSGLGQRLREIGRDLHLVETVQVYLGGRSASVIIERIQKGSQAFGALVDSLDKAQGG